jgi:ADP-heptose:LPS heptosyltransferase
MKNSRQKLVKANRQFSRKSKPFLLKAVISILGPIEEALFEGPLDSILIIAQEKLGDAILLTPLIGNLRRARPELQIHIVTFSSVYEFFRNDSNVDAVYRGKKHYVSYYKSMRDRRFDLLFNTKDHASFTGLYQSRLLPARHRVGISHPFNKGYFHHTLDFDYHRHVVEKNIALLDYLNIPYEEEDCRPYLPEGPITEAIKHFSFTSDGRIVGVNLSAGDAEREWPLDKWKAFIEKVQSPVIVFAMPDRLEDKHKLTDTFNNVINTPQTRSIYDVGRMMQYLDYLITPDTSLVHLASCYSIPTVALYGSDPEQYERFYPYLVPHRQVRSSSDRIADISVSEVVTAMESLMDETR